MTRPIHLSYTPKAADANGLADDVTGGVFTLSATSAGDGLAHLLTVTNNSTTDFTGDTISFTGIGPDGYPVTETIAGPDDSATVTTTKYFLNVSVIELDVDSGEDTFDIGYDDVAVSPTVYIDYQQYSWPLTNAVYVDNTNISYTIQHTTDDPYYDFINNTPRTPVYISDTNATNKTATQESTVTYPIMAQRLLINSASAGTDTIRWNILHSNESGGAGR